MPMMDMMNMMEMMPDMEGMMGEAATEMPEGVFTDPPMMMGMMAGLNRLEGTEYDIAWMEAMIDHHDDAIRMAERLLERVPEGEGHAELRSLAEQIIADQTAEIEALESLISQVSA